MNNKIVHFPVKKDIESVEDFVRDLLFKLESGEISGDKIAIVLNSPEPKQVMTGYYNCDLLDKQTLMSHIQIDIMWGVVKSNIDDILE